MALRSHSLVGFTPERLPSTTGDVVYRRVATNLLHHIAISRTTRLMLLGLYNQPAYCVPVHHRSAVCVQDNKATESMPVCRAAMASQDEIYIIDLM